MFYYVLPQKYYRVPVVRIIILDEIFTARGARVASSNTETPKQLTIHAPLILLIEKHSTKLQVHRIRTHKRPVMSRKRRLFPNYPVKAQLRRRCCAPKSLQVQKIFPEQQQNVCKQTSSRNHRKS